MIHRFEIENFYSIRDAQVIDLRAAGNAPEDSERLAPLWKGATETAPKVIALFGPNASGKSNVLRALSFVAWFVQVSFAAPPDKRLPFERFNDAESLKARTRLAVHLGAVENITEAGDPEAAQCRHVYELVIGGGDQHAVESETLYYWPSYAGRRVTLFARDAQGKVTAGKAFDLSGYRQALENVLRPNASVISTLAQLNHPYATQIRNVAALVMSNILIEKGDVPEQHIVQYYADKPELVKLFNREVERVDFGIRALELQSSPDGTRAYFRHHGLAYSLPLLYESNGTRQFLKLYPLLIEALETGGIALLDELDLLHSSDDAVRDSALVLRPETKPQ